jgi:hypothetical protein
MATEEKKDVIEQIKQGANEIVKRINALSEMESKPGYDMLLLGTLEYCGYLGYDLRLCIRKADSDLKDSLSIVSNTDDDIPF